MSSLTEEEKLQAMIDSITEEDLQETGVSREELSNTYRVMFGKEMLHLEEQK